MKFIGAYSDFSNRILNIFEYVIIMMEVLLKKRPVFGVKIRGLPCWILGCRTGPLKSASRVQGPVSMRCDPREE